MDSLVSIVTVTYNLIKANRKEVFIKAMDSVKRQTYPHIEHIIMDGASTDGTLDLFKEIDFIKNHKIYSEPDTGMWDAMNKGIKKATGKYIIFLNSDDYYVYDDAIYDLVKKLEDEDADYVVSNFALILLNGNFRSKFYKNIPILPKELCYRTMTYHHETLLCKKSVYEELGYHDEKYRTATDYHFNIKLILNGKKQAYLNKPTIAARAGGTTTGNDAVPTNATFQNVRLIWNDLFLMSLTEEDVAQVLTTGGLVNDYFLEYVFKFLLNKNPKGFSYARFLFDVDHHSLSKKKRIFSVRKLQKNILLFSEKFSNILSRFILRVYYSKLKLKNLFKSIYS